MKKKLLITAALILALVFMLGGCVFSGGKEYEVTFVLGEGIDPVTVMASSSSDLYEPEPPSEDLVFAGWFLDKELTRPFLLDKISENMTLYARFLKKSEKVVTYVYDNGSADTSIIFEGTLVEPPKPSKEGYVFVGWVDAADTGDSLYTFGRVPTAAHTVLVATWRESTRGVLFTVHPENGDATFTESYAYSAKPNVPEQPTNGSLDFMGWYADPDCTVLFDFDAPMTADTHVYAGWDIDLLAVGNLIASEVLPSAVKINTVRAGLGIISISLGSGVIYEDHAGYYYVLTNYHVVKPQGGYYSASYELTDAYGNEYSAECVVMDESYDLAVLRFKKGEKELPTASFAALDPAVGSTVISVGNPHGLSNSVTYGEVSKYAITDVNGLSVSFSVGWHNAPIYQGSSGGAVFNTDGEIVGINFASALDNTSGEFMIGAFIQRSKVAEFLTLHNVIFS